MKSKFSETLQNEGPAPPGAEWWTGLGKVSEGFSAQGLGTAVETGVLDSGQSQAPLSLPRSGGDVAAVVRARRRGLRGAQLCRSGAPVPHWGREVCAAEGLAAQSLGQSNHYLEK